ncbi:MAG: CpXC domain-containing protein [Anaerolineae bacterium]|nr:CpXC domain-containing protein [Anaerolineae bacterium]
MPQVMLARVTCPNCHNPFQAPVEQVMDVRTDPSVKARLLNGLINVVVCPHCGVTGALNLPFLYHDPDKELALVYMPIEVGHDNLKRQQAIGKFTNAVMNNLPPEERKAYLLQPQVFLTLENLVNKIFEADGITQEMIEEQKAKAALLQRMINATSDEVLEAMIRENDETIDVDFLRMLTMNLEIAQATKQEADVQRLLVVHSKLLELSSEGRAAKARGELMEALQAEPTRENLLGSLIQAPDERTRELLVTFGRPLLDYPFFQSLTSRIESAPDKDEQERLTALRTEILAVRDRFDEATRALYKARATLLRDLLLSNDPEALARRRFEELDGVFLNVLASGLEDARAANEIQAIQALQSIQNLTLRLVDEAAPPELRLLNRLMAAESNAEIEKLLQENHDLVTERLAQSMEGVEASMREDGMLEAAEHLALVLEKVKETIAQATTV